MKKSELTNLIESIVRKQLKEADYLRGGKGDNKTIEDIAKKHGLPVDYIEKELQVGIAVEREHSSHVQLATEIAVDHLFDNGHYYIKLIKSGLVDELKALQLYKSLRLYRYDENGEVKKEKETKKEAKNESFNRLNEIEKTDMISVYIVSGMYNDDINGITGNPYLAELVTASKQEAIKYFNSVNLKTSLFYDIKNGKKNKIYINVVDYVEQYANFDNNTHDCYIDITIDECKISSRLFNIGISGYEVREYANYKCDTIKEKKLFFDGSIGGF